MVPGFSKFREQFRRRLAQLGRDLRVVKLRRWSRLWLRDTIRGSFAPVFGGSEFLQWLALPIFLWLVFLWRGYSEMSAEFTLWWAGKQALIWALPIWILANGIFAALRSSRTHRSSGEWVGRRFVYHEPVLAFSRLALPAENNRIFKFNFKDAEPGCLINYKVHLDGSPSRISVIVMAHPNQWQEFKSHDELTYSGGNLSTNHKRDMYLRYFLAAQSDPFQIRIYVTGWELQDHQTIF
jgi:hypothetical protein